jgi:phosphoribosylformylglycinamidine (FGAM) synthase PurS component
MDAASEAEARGRADEMCRKLLANPILEDYTIE